MNQRKLLGQVDKGTHELDSRENFSEEVTFETGLEGCVELPVTGSKQSLILQTESSGPLERRAEEYSATT